MDTPRHSDRDRITIAGLTGIAYRRSVQLAKGQCALADAVAELKARSADPHLIAHAVSGRDDWAYRQCRQLVEAAGADPADVDDVIAAVEARLKRGGGLGQLADNIQAAHAANRRSATEAAE